MSEWRELEPFDLKGMDENFCHECGERVGWHDSGGETPRWWAVWQRMLATSPSQLLCEDCAPPIRVWASGSGRQVSWDEWLAAIGGPT